MNQAEAHAMLPVIDTYLDHYPVWDGTQVMPGPTPVARLKSEDFCNAAIIEIRPDGHGWRVGLEMNCGDFARSGHTLLEGTAGYPGMAEVATLADRHGRYQVLSLKIGPESYDQAWVDANFSSAAAAEILSANPPTAPDPIDQARRAFGFAPGTPAVES